MSTRSHPLLKGALFMSISFFFIACTGALLKITTAASSVFFAVWLAYLFGFIFQLIRVLPHGLGFYKTHHIVKHFFRAFFGVLATYLYVIALEHIALMNATLLFNTTPLFVPILAMLFLRNKVHWETWLAIIVGFIGIAFIIRPNMTILEKPWDLIGLFSGIFLAVAYVFVKILTSTDPIERVVFYFFAFGTLLSSALIPFFWGTPSINAWFYGGATGLAFVLAQIFVVKAYHAADPAAVGPFQYVSVIAAGIIGWIFWDKIPTPFDYIGTALVILGGVLVILLSKNKPTPC